MAEYLDKQGLELLMQLNASKYEVLNNKITTKSASPDTTKYPSEKLLFDELERFELTDSDISEIVYG